MFYPNNIIQIVIAGLTVIVGGVVLNLLYNVYLHPLRSYPGRFFWRASRIPKAYHLVRGDIHLQIKAMHDEYGHIVRIEPNQLTYTDPAAAQEITGFGTKEQKGNLPRDPGHYNSISLTGATSIFSASDVDHSRLRKLQSHAFSDKALAAQEEFMQKYTQLMISELKQRSSSPHHNGVVDMVAWLNFLTFDLIGDLAFGESFKCLETGELNPWISGLFGGVSQYLTLIRAAKFLPFAGPISRALIPKKLVIARQQNIQWSAEKVERRIAADTKRPDFMSYILKYNDTDKGMTLPELKEASIVFIFAGSETTATLLSGLTYYLLTNPDTMQKLTHEIRSTFTNHEDITILAIAKLPYLRAAIEEGLRIYPPAPNLFPRCSPPGGAVICGQFVPEGTSVAVHQYAMHHSARNFSRPEEFHPERWTGDEAFADDQRQCLNPFSLGLRNCIGKNMAYTEMRLTMAHLLFEFDMELLEESKNWTDQRTFGLWEKGPMMVKLTSRSG